MPAAIEETLNYWVAYLAATIAHAVGTDPFDVTRVSLKNAVGDFKKTEACSPELRRQLTRIEKGER